MKTSLIKNFVSHWKNDKSIRESKLTYASNIHWVNLYEAMADQAWKQSFEKRLTLRPKRHNIVPVPNY